MTQQKALVLYILHLADNALILGHRNSEWTGHGPILEQDIAISNIALDLIGQARYCYQYAAALLANQGGEPQAPGTSPGVSDDAANAPQFHEGALLPGTVITEDHLAYLRDSWDFSNSLLTEQPNGDWAVTILRQFLFSAYHYLLYHQLQYSKDSQLAAIGEKAIKEVAYHLRWSSEWVIRLGDGTEESQQRLKKALPTLWKFTGELFVPAPYETAMANAGIGVDPASLRSKWEERVGAVFQEAGLGPLPAAGPGVVGGKTGRHTEHLGYVLAEMQFLQRAYPGCEW